MRAAQYRQMAAEATAAAVRDELLQLAQKYDGLVSPSEIPKADRIC